MTMKVAYKIAAAGLLGWSLLGVGAASALAAQSCEEVVRQLNRNLPHKIDEKELVTVLRSLNDSGSARLPDQFVTKRQAKKLGWQPGKDLWAYENLRGKSIGGDVFRNREGQLPDGGKSWHEADLDYKGGHRGGKRILFSNDGLREVTVDHYRTFTEVPACQ